MATYLGQLFNTRIKVQQGTLAVRSGEVQELKSMEQAERNLLSEESRAVVQDRSVVKLIQEAESDLQKLSQDQALASQIEQQRVAVEEKETHIRAREVQIQQERRNPYLRTIPTTTQLEQELRVLQKEDMRLRQRLNFELQDAINRVQDIFTKIGVIHRVINAVRQSKTLQLQQETQLEGWTNAARERALQIRNSLISTLQQTNAGIPSVAAIPVRQLRTLKT